jgi:hypothetical protein
MSHQCETCKSFMLCYNADSRGCNLSITPRLNIKANSAFGVLTSISSCLKIGADRLRPTPFVERGVFLCIATVTSAGRYCYEQ